MHVLVSFSPHDDAIAQRVIADLRAQQITVFTVPSGHPDAQGQIIAALSDCQWLIVLQSPAAFQSTEVQTSVQTAQRLVQAGQMRGIIAFVLAAPDATSAPAYWAAMPQVDATHLPYATALASLVQLLQGGTITETRGTSLPPQPIYESWPMQTSPGSPMTPPNHAPAYTSQPYSAPFAGAYTPGDGPPTPLPGNQWYAPHALPRRNSNQTVFALLAVGLVVLLILFLVVRNLGIFDVHPATVTTTTVVTSVPMNQNTPIPTAYINPCTQIAAFANATTASAGVGFAGVTFSSNSLGYDTGFHAAPASGYQTDDLFVCSPSVTGNDVRGYFASNMPTQGWRQTAAFPGNHDGNCGDPYCWTNGTNFVGLVVSPNADAISGIATYELQLVN